MDPFGKQQAILQGSSFAYENNVIGPFMFKYEYAAGITFGIGLVFCYYQYSMNQYQTLPSNSTNSGSQRTIRDEFLGKNVSGGMRFNYHLNGSNRFDPYIGLAVGYSNYIYRSKSYRNNVLTYREKEQTAFPFYFAFTLGARYDLTPWLGIYGELGIDAWNLIQTGINFRLNKKPQIQPRHDHSQ